MVQILLMLLWTAGFNSTLRQGCITHHEYIQVLILLSLPFEFSSSVSHPFWPVAVSFKIFKESLKPSWLVVGRNHGQRTTNNTRSGRGTRKINQQELKNWRSRLYQDWERECHWKSLTHYWIATSTCCILRHMHGEGGSLAGGELGHSFMLHLCVLRCGHGGVSSRSWVGGARPCCIDACAGRRWRDVPGINLANEAEVGTAWLDRERASGVNWAGPYRLSTLIRVTPHLPCHDLSFFYYSDRICI